MGKVVIRDIKKSYGKVEVLHGINIDIADGEFVVIVGPSGCGKSTLLRMVAGLEEISSGDIFIDDRIVNEIEPKDRNIAMVFQNYALYPHMSMFDNMAYGLKLQKLSKVEIKRRVAEVAKTLQLEEFLQRKPRQLSGGQRQRVAMGRAIVRNPKVFLFDEPLSNLDAKLRVQMRLEIKRLQRSLGVTALYVTHDQIEAMTMADKIVVMQAGHIEQIGAPLELYDTPANTFVAGFIGSPSMNFFDGTVGQPDGNGGATIDIDGVAFPAGPRQGLTPGQRVTFGIRPEHLELADTGIGVQVAVVEPTGSETHVISRLKDREVVAVFRERHPLEAGQQITLRPDPEQVHLFDADTGTRID